MKAHVMKLENNCVIVDEEYFNEIKKESEFNQEKINEIAEELGFTDESHLSKFFRKNKGCSPSSFRKSNNILETDVSCYLPEKRNP